MYDSREDRRWRCFNSRKKVWHTVEKPEVKNVSLWLAADSNRADDELRRSNLFIA